MKARLEAMESEQRVKDPQVKISASSGTSWIRFRHGNTCSNGQFSASSHVAHDLKALF